jgi:hypothetical protein
MNQDIKKILEEYQTKTDNRQSVIKDIESITDNGQSDIEDIKSIIENIKTTIEDNKNIIDDNNTKDISLTTQPLSIKTGRIMKVKITNSENEAFQAYKLALTNAELQAEIASAMATYGYSAQVIAEGKALLDETIAAYNSNQKENNETREAKANFDQKYSDLQTTYNKHRKLAKVVFRNDDLNYQKLALKGRVPQAYVNCMAIVKTFYSEIVNDNNLQSKLARLNFTKEEAENGLSFIADLENLRNIYLREKGESQEATQKKDVTFAKLDNWMQDFYAVAKIAMEEQPQLLEAIGILVRS